MHELLVGAYRCQIEGHWRLHLVQSLFLAALFYLGHWHISSRHCDGSVLIEKGEMSSARSHWDPQSICDIQQAHCLPSPRDNHVASVGVCTAVGRLERYGHAGGKRDGGDCRDKAA